MKFIWLIKLTLYTYGLWNLPLSIDVLYGQSQKYLIQKQNGVDNVFVKSGSERVQLTHFKDWHFIEDVQLSSDAQFLFIRHKAGNQRAYRLRTYNLNEHKLIAEIIPGFGGSFQWNNNHQIIHYWGCGTNCANLSVYDKHLVEVFSTLSSGGYAFNPLKDIIIQFSMNGGQFALYDLNSLKDKNLKGFTYTISRSPEREWTHRIWSLEFTDDYIFRIQPTAYANSIEPLIFDLKIMQLTPISPGGVE